MPRRQKNVAAKPRPSPDLGLECSDLGSNNFALMSKAFNAKRVSDSRFCLNAQSLFRQLSCGAERSVEEQHASMDHHTFDAPQHTPPLLPTHTLHPQLLLPTHGSAAQAIRTTGDIPLAHRLTRHFSRQQSRFHPCSDLLRTWLRHHVH